jgi:hypothetical protein
VPDLGLAPKVVMGTGAANTVPIVAPGRSPKETGALVESYKVSWTSRGGWQISRHPRTFGRSGARHAEWRAGPRVRAYDCMGTVCGHGGCSGLPRRLARRPR